MSSTESTVTVDELWIEFKKAIDYGHFRKFKTKRGMMGHIKRIWKNQGGKSIRFVFSPEIHKYKLCILNVTKEMWSP